MTKHCDNVGVVPATPPVPPPAGDSKFGMATSCDTDEQPAAAAACDHDGMVESADICAQNFDGVAAARAAAANASTSLHMCSASTSKRPNRVRIWSRDNETSCRPEIPPCAYAKTMF